MDKKTDKDLAAKTERSYADLLGRANSGDKNALASLKELCEKGDLRIHEGLAWKRASADMVVARSGKDALFSQYLIGCDMDDLCKEIYGPEPSPLERVLAERVVVCAAAVDWYEAIANKNLVDVSLAQGDYLQRLVDRAHRRFLSACEALARVRRLEIPAVQVNIGEKQVNIAAAKS